MNKPGASTRRWCHQGRQREERNLSLSLCVDWVYLMRVKQVTEPSAIHRSLALCSWRTVLGFLGRSLALIQSSNNSGTIQVSWTYQKNHRHADPESSQGHSIQEAAEVAASLRRRERMVFTHRFMFKLPNRKQENTSL